MTLDRQPCYRALKSRDARFDGRFFVGVHTTGVYCRPVCPARTPKLKNIDFYPCAAAAEQAGFRPCLRCRPETSPGTPAWIGTSATVSRALRLIEGGALDGGSVADLAARLGIGDRHLRRLFLTHLGVTPQAVAGTRRTHFAKRLLDDTDLPITQIAFSAGFASVRRFNAAMRDTFERSPTELRSRRRRTGMSLSGTGTTIRLPFREPFDWDAMLAFLGPRAIPGVECVSDGSYRRSFRIDNVTGTVEVTRAIGAAHLNARVSADNPAVLPKVAARLVRLFDVRADPAAIQSCLSRDSRLARLVSKRPGLRVPGAFDGFELAVRAVLGQQVTVRGATTLSGRLVTRFGRKINNKSAIDATSGELTHTFASAQRLARADLTEIGLPSRRGAAIGALSRAVASGAIALDATGDLDDALAQLTAVDGLGPWTAGYIAMRSLGEPDAFPIGDLGLRKALGTAAAPVSAGQVTKLAAAWSPWRAYAAMHLWAGLGDAPIPVSKTTARRSRRTS